MIRKTYGRKREVFTGAGRNLFIVGFNDLYSSLNIFLLMAQQPIMGHGLLIIEASRSHSDTPHPVGLLWTSDQPTQRPVPDDTSIPSTNFEPAFPARERPQTDALARAATGIGH
jgi:hypothetical protein